MTTQSHLDSSAEQRGVKVKPLEWREVREGLWRADAALDRSYYVNHRTGMWLGFDEDWALADGDPKDAAQADYDQRILSALLPVTPASIRTDALREAAAVAKHLLKFADTTNRADEEIAAAILSLIDTPPDTKDKDNGK